MWRSISSISVMLAGVAMLSGCFEASADGKFQPNGAVEMAVELGVSAQFLAMAQNKPGEAGLLESCGTIQRHDEVPKGMKVLSASRGTKGDKITCKVVLLIDDPVAAASEFKRAAKDDDPLIIDAISITRLGSGGYRLLAAIEANPQAVQPAGNNNSGMEAMGRAMAVAMTANHYLSLSVTAQRIEKATGEMSVDGRTSTWKLPVSLLVAPVAGFRQDIKADIIFSETWIDKARRFIGLD